jgi:hypothetical protein
LRAIARELSVSAHEFCERSQFTLTVVYVGRLVKHFFRLEGADRSRTFVDPSLIDIFSHMNILARALYGGSQHPSV